MSTLKRKLETRFHEKKVSPGQPVDKFIAELDSLLQNLHKTTLNYRNQKLKKINIRGHSHDKLNIPSYSHETHDKLIIPGHSHETLDKLDIPGLSHDNQFNMNQPNIPIIMNKKKQKNYHRLIKRLNYKFHITNTIIRRTDKSKVFHLGKKQDYKLKSDEYMSKTQAYKCLDNNDPLPELINRTNKYLLDLRLAHWINQKQYEELSVKPDEVELSHLYYLPKAHKLNTPLRPIIAGLKHPTIKISRFLDNLLRPLFNQMAKEDTVDSASELIKKLDQWSKEHMKKETLFCTIDITDLYTMIPQTEGILSLKKMMDHLNLKQVGGLKTETIIRLSRFVVQNNYFSYNDKYYHQVRGGAMGSPLTLTMANCYMYFFEREIVKQVKNSGGLYVRYIDDIFITTNWPTRHLSKEINRWGKIDLNIKLNSQFGYSNNFLDLYIENIAGQLFTKVYHKPSHEPYYLPFNSVHPLHMKKNIPFVMLTRAIRYCSTFEAYVNERESLRMAFLLNKYPGSFIDLQFTKVWKKFNIDPTINGYNYNKLRQQIIESPENEKEIIDYRKHIFIHFTYCLTMKQFPKKFHILWNKYFSASPIADIVPVLGFRNTKNLQQRLVKTRKLY